MIRGCIHWLGILIGLVLAFNAHAAEVVYPIGSRIGLVPPEGVSPSPNFVGFEDTTHNVAITMASLPPEAYSQLEEAAAAPIQGVTIENREQLQLPAGKSFLVVVRQEANNFRLRKWILTTSASGLTALVTFQVPDDAVQTYPEDAIRASLSSIAIRPEIPTDEQLSLIPFKVGDLAGLRIGGVIMGRALMLIDAGPEEAPQGKPQLVIGLAPGGPTLARDHALFAEDLFAHVPNLKEVRVNSSEPLRISGQQGHQIMAHGKEASTGADVTVVQWVRFGSGAYMQIIGVARNELWPELYARFRRVRDSIDAP